MFKKLVSVALFCILALSLVACSVTDPSGKTWYFSWDNNAPTAAPTSGPTATMAPTLAPTATLTMAPTADASAPTAVPTAQAPTAAPTAAPAQPSNSLAYDKGDGKCMDRSNLESDPKAANQADYLSYYLCVANNEGDTQAALEKAVVAIQGEAQAAGADVKQAKGTLSLTNDSAWLVWIPNAEGAVVPNDVAFPVQVTHSAQGQIYILPPAAAGINTRTFTVPNDVEIWAVRVH